jgi:hypothetical protein
MDIRSFKLTTGEELVAELIKMTSTGYVVKNPLVVHVMRGQDGQGALAFAQWSMVQQSDTQIEIFGHGLIAHPVELLDEVAKSYVQQTSSIIISPTAASQILRG